MKRLSLAFLGIALIVACGNVQEKKLVGKWQAASVTEDGMPMPISPADIGFEFFENGYYHYRSTLSYKEAGSFSVQGSLLYTLDTLNKASTEKSVQILELTQDSLFLKMNNEGKIQEVRLGRVK
jgi:hypothetical protein